MSAADLQDFLAREFADISALGIIVERVDEQTITLRLPAESAMIRPGGTISGPTMFSLADVSVWLLILAQIGPVALAVTTSVGMNFFRKPPPGDLVAEGELLKLGARLAVGHVRLHAEGSRELVADASITLSLIHI